MDSGDSVSRTDFVDCISNQRDLSEVLPDPPQNDSLAPFDPLPTGFGTPESCLEAKNSEQPEAISANRDSAGETLPSDSTNNIVATWADEFYRMREAKFSGENFEHQGLVANSVDPPLNQGNFLSPQQPPQDNFLPTTVDPYRLESDKPFKCHFCKTSYGTPGRLKRHFSTKKHKAATEKVAQSIELPTATPPKAMPPKATPPRQDYEAERGEKLPDVPALSEHMYQSLSPVKLPQMQMPQFKTYNEYTSSASVDPYPTDWPVFPNHMDFLRSSQNQSPSVEPHHAQNSLFFQHHLSPSVRYGKIPFSSSLCNPHQSSQYVSETIPSPEQHRSYPHPSFYQPQTPPTPSWYYPITPYPSPNPYLQRYPEFSTVQESYQKFETNNNYFPSDPDPKPFDQRPFQQEALNLWTPKITNPELDVSVEEVDTISNDDSETMSPAVSPDSQHEPVSSSDCPELIPNLETPSPEPEQKWRCEQCNREFTKSCYLTQHYNAAHPMECPFKCEICNQSYQNLTLLAKHSCVGVGAENPFTCDVCDKGFESKIDLTRHKYLHSANGGAKNFSCHLCPKSCVRKDQLLRHIRVHESHGEGLTKQYPG